MAVTTECTVTLLKKAGVPQGAASEPALYIATFSRGKKRHSGAANPAAQLFHCITLQLFYARMHLNSRQRIW